MVGALYNRLNELQFELYVAKQIKDTQKQKQIERKIKKVEKELEEEIKKGDE